MKTYLAAAIGLVAGVMASSVAQSQGTALKVPAALSSAGVINIGIAPSFYPNAYYEPGTKELRGIDPDLARAIAAKLGIKAELVVASFPALITGVASQKFDVAMSDITDTAERQKQASFVDYLVARRIAYTLAANPRGVSGAPLSMCGLSAPSQAGTEAARVLDKISEQCVAAGKKPLNLIAIQGHEGVQLTVNSERSDFAVTAMSEAALFEKEAKGKYVWWQVDGIPPNYSGIVTRKDDTELQQALLGALNQLRADGTYEAILKKYNLPDAVIEKFGINLATQK